MNADLIIAIWAAIWIIGIALCYWVKAGETRRREEADFRRTMRTRYRRQ